MNVLANGINIGYEVEGSGETMVFIHSLGLNRRMWWLQTPAFNGRFRVLSYDIRGHGETDKPHGPYSLELLAGDLEALLRTLGIGRVHLIGVSMGGMVAQQFAIAYPRMAQTLTLVGASSTLDADTRSLFEVRANLVEVEGMTAIVDGLIDRWFTPAFARREKALVDRIKEMVLESDPHAYASSCRAVAGLDLLSKLHQISAPTLIVVGADDLVTPPEAVEVTHDHIAGSLLHIIPQAAHLCNIECAEEFNHTLLDFLA